MMLPPTRSFVSFLAALCLALPGAGQESEESPPGTSPQGASPPSALDLVELTIGETAPELGDMTARLVAALTTTTVTVTFERTPAREAFNELRLQLGVPLIGRYLDDRLGYGIDPETEISLDAEELPALVALEEVLAQCSTPDDECTWQIRKGYIEFGTKSRLSVPAACYRRVYYIRDMTLVPLSRGESRQLLETIALDLVEVVVTTIEPELWDWGQEIPDEEDAEADPRLSTGADGSGAAGGSGADSQSRASRRVAPARIYVPPKRPATIRYWRDVIIVHAPGFVHRQVAGMPDNSGSGSVDGGGAPLPN